MKIELRRLPAEGLILEEQFSASTLDLQTSEVTFSGPLALEARVFRITNAVTIELDIRGTMLMSCSRCLQEFEAPLRKKARLNYRVERSDTVLDISQDIREEVMLEYPIKALCSNACRGLCPRCGKNLNEGGCSCGST